MQLDFRKCQGSMQREGVWLFLCAQVLRLSSTANSKHMLLRLRTARSWAFCFFFTRRLREKGCSQTKSGFHIIPSCPSLGHFSAPIHSAFPFFPDPPSSPYLCHCFSVPPGFPIHSLGGQPSSPGCPALLPPLKWLWGTLPTAGGTDPASSSRCCPSVPLLWAARRTAGTISHTKQPETFSTESVILCLGVNARRVKGREYLSLPCTT